jgi:hypothetical protein
MPPKARKARTEYYTTTSPKKKEYSLIFKFSATNSKEMSIVEIGRVLKYSV